MDGNTTNEDEDEFITELRTGMPEISKNFDRNFELIATIDEMIKEMIE